MYLCSDPNLSVQVVGAVGWGNARLEIPENIPEPIRKLMAACMESDPQKRPDFEEIIVSLRTIRRDLQLPPAITPQVGLTLYNPIPLQQSLSAGLAQNLP